MKNLDFTYIAAKNFLCFGPEGIEKDLTVFGNIILIRGNNLDIQEKEEGVSSNGTGKTSIPEVLVYTLFSKTIKQPKKLSHKNVINNQIGKNLRTEIRWGNFRVVRTRKPDALQIWESSNGDWESLGDKEWENDHEISLGGMPATQKLIEEKLGMNYETFVNVVVFTDNNTGCFLECDTPTKRGIVENLLSLDKYRLFSDIAKEMRSELKEKIKSIINECDSLLDQIKTCHRREEQIDQQKKQWLQSRQIEIEKLQSEEVEKRKELTSTDQGEAISIYQQSRDKIRHLMESIPSMEEKLLKLNDMIRIAEDKERTGKDRLSEIRSVMLKNADVLESSKSSIAEWKNKIKALESKEGARCDECFGPVSVENYGVFVKQLTNKIEHCSSVVNVESNKLIKSGKQEVQLKSNISKVQEAINIAKSQQSKLNLSIQESRREIAKLDKIEKPENKDTNQAILENQLATLIEQVSVKKKEIEGPSPYTQIQDSNVDETKEKTKKLKEKKQELTAAEDELPYYEFWTTGFGDKGIRKFVIEGIIPALNSRIAHWLQFLIDGKIKLEFDNKLEETISRNPSDGDPFVYAQMSRGEQRRLNLAVSQGFAHVMMLNSGIAPSVVFLDEVTTNIDPMGVIGIYNMILELAKDRMVFVTTHDQGLLEMLEGCEKLLLEKKGGFTKLVNPIMKD